MRQKQKQRGGNNKGRGKRQVAFYNYLKNNKGWHTMKGILNATMPQATPGGVDHKYLMAHPRVVNDGAKMNRKYCHVKHLEDGYQEFKKKKAKLEATKPTPPTAAASIDAKAPAPDTMEIDGKTAYRLKSGEWTFNKEAYRKENLKAPASPEELAEELDIINRRLVALEFATGLT